MEKEKDNMKLLVLATYASNDVEDGYVYSNATTLGVVESVGEALDLAKDHYEYLVREDAEAACLVDIDSEEGQEEIKYYIEKHMNLVETVFNKYAEKQLALHRLTSIAEYEYNNSFDYKTEKTEFFVIPIEM
jgi:hypothetical protein